MNYDEIQEFMSQACGTEHYNLISPICNRVVCTDSILGLFKKARCFWIGDVLVSYYPKLRRTDETGLFTLSINVRENKSCVFNITREEYNYDTEKSSKKTVVRQLIPYTDLPTGKYEFFVGVQPIDPQYRDVYYVLMNKGDY